MILKSLLLLIISISPISNSITNNFYSHSKTQFNEQIYTNDQEILNTISNVLEVNIAKNNNFYYTINKNLINYKNQSKKDLIKQQIFKDKETLNLITSALNEKNYEYDINLISFDCNFNLNNNTCGNLIIIYNQTSITLKNIFVINGDDWFYQDQTNKQFKTFSFDAIKYNMNSYQSKDLNVENVLKNIVQFQDNRYIGDYKLFSTEMTFDGFNEVYKPELIINSINQFNYQNVVNFSLRIKNNNAIYESPNNLVIFNLVPTIKFNLNNNLTNNSINLNSIDSSLGLSGLSANEFANNFQNNIIKMIFNFNENYHPFITNILESDFYNFNPKIKIGNIDNIAGTINNNLVSITIPNILYKCEFDEKGFPLNTYIDEYTGLPIINPTYSTLEYANHINVNFNIIANKQDVVLNFNNVINTFDVSVHNELSEMSASTFNLDFFEKYLVNYNSSLVNNFLISINTNIDYFNEILKDFSISDIDDLNGSLICNISIINPTNNVLINKQYKLVGFRKTIDIQQYKSEINIKNLSFLNLNKIQNEIMNNNINLFSNDDIYAILSDSKIFSSNLTNNEFIQYYDSYQIEIFKNLGEINLIINLKNIDNNGKKVNLHLNGSQIINNQIHLVINGFNKKISINQVNDFLNITTIENLNLNNILNNSLSTIGENLISYNDLNNGKWLNTNLSSIEFNKLINNIKIDKSLDYGYAILTINFNKKYIEHPDINLSLKAISENMIDTSNFNKSLNASEINDLNYLNVDDIDQNKVINLFKFNSNNIQQYEVNNNFVGTFNCSREIFEKFILNECNIKPNNDSVNVNLSLKNNNGKITKFSFNILNLKPSNKFATNITIAITVSIISVVALAIIIIVILRLIKKRKILKNNKWEEKEIDSLDNIIGEKDA